MIQNLGSEYPKAEFSITTYQGPEETGLLLSYLRAVFILRIYADSIHFRKLDISKLKIDEILQFTSKNGPRVQTRLQYLEVLWIV